MSANPFLLSPGVLVQEFSLTGAIPAVAATPGGIAGEFSWGPINKRVLVDSENTSESSLYNRFFKPDNTNYLTFLTAAQFLSYGGQLWVVRSGNTQYRNATADGSGLLIKNRDDYEASYLGGAGSVGLWAARYAGTLGNQLRVSICPSTQAYSNTLPTANTTSGSNLIIFAANVALLIAPGDLLTVGTLGTVEVTAVANANVTVNSSSIINATLTANSASRKWKYYNAFTGAPGTSAFVANKNGANDQVHIVIVDQNGGFSGQANTILEKYQGLSLASDAKNFDGTTNYYKTVLFQKSAYAYWMAHLPAGTNWGNTAQGTTFTQVNIPNYVTLAGGVDGVSTDGDVETAYGYFTKPEDVDIRFLMNAGHDTTVGNFLVSSIAAVRKDCVAYVSPNQSDVVNNYGNEANSCITTRNSYPSTSYGFMDSNWKYTYDKYNDQYRWIPCNGDTAGLQAQIALADAIWVPGAGYNNGQLKNVTKLGWNPGQADRDLLFPSCINPIVQFPGDGTILYGDKTLLSDGSDFDAIGIRMLFIILEKAISRAARFMLWKFNNASTQAQFKNMVNPYLRDIQGRGAINDFEVVCDARNNPPSVVQAKQFVGTIYIQPGESIRNIILQFVDSPQGVSFDTIIGQPLN